MVEAMTESRFDPEDEAFNEIERQSQQRKEAVLQALHSENQRLGLYKDAYVKAQMQTLPEKPKFEATATRLDRIGVESGIKEMTNELYLYGVNVREDLGKEFNYYFHLTRNDTIEEVAQHIEKLKGFGQDTVSSLAIYIREMKK
jgi:hypothetical protein